MLYYKDFVYDVSAMSHHQVLTRNTFKDRFKNKSIIVTKETNNLQYFKNLHRHQHATLATESCHLYKVYDLSNTKEILKFITLETDKKTLATKVNKLIKYCQRHSKHHFSKGYIKIL